MSFSLDTSDFPNLNSYSLALDWYNLQKPWRDGDPRVHPLEKRTKKYCTIVLREDNAVSCRMYGTELVVYRPDGVTEIHLGAYSSVSTDSFINALIRGTGTAVRANCSRYKSVWKHGQSHYEYGYIVAGPTALLDANHNVTNSTDIRVPMLNKTRASKVRRAYYYNDFTSWRKVVQALREPNQQPRGWYLDRRGRHYGTLLEQDIPAMLKSRDIEQWKTLMEGASNDYILGALYKARPDCVEIHTQPRFIGFNDWNNARTLDRKYGWAL